MSYGYMDGWHGDEPEITADINEWQRRYEDERADEWQDSKYEFQPQEIIILTEVKNG